MRFKIKGETTEGNQSTNYVEILGKQAIGELIDKHIKETLKEQERLIEDIRARVYSLEEEIMLIKKRL
jgi:hypothetical protein